MSPTATLDDNAPGFRPEAPSVPTAGHDEKPSKIPIPDNAPRQMVLFDVTGEAAPMPDLVNDLTAAEESHAASVAAALADYLDRHSTGTVEAAVAAAGITPPRGVRLWVAHPAAVRRLLKDGRIRFTGGATPGRAPQAHGGLVRVWAKGCP